MRAVVQDTTNSVWCFARLFHYPGAELLQAISLYCLRHWHRFKPQELANMIWSLALLRACSPHTWWVHLTRTHTPLTCDQCHARDLGGCMGESNLTANSVLNA